MMTENAVTSEAVRARAARVLTLVANECSPYLRNVEELNSRLFECYWETAEQTDLENFRAILDIAGQILLNTDAELCRWTGLLTPYDAAGSVRQLLEPLIRPNRLDEVLAPHQLQLDMLCDGDMVGVLAVAWLIRDDCPPEFLRIA